jgi:plasmid stabilization system protein ParE
MVEKLYRIFWTKRSQIQLKQIHLHISKDSPENASKVIGEIISSVNRASSNPEIYGPDKFKMNNDGSYRSFEKFHYRISYRFSTDVIVVLRVRHTSMEPLQY